MNVNLKGTLNGIKNYSQIFTENNYNKIISSANGFIYPSIAEGGCLVIQELLMTYKPIPEFDDKGRLTGYKKDRDNQVVLSKINEGLLKQIAQTSGGSYFSSSLGQFVMDQVYKDISQFEQKRLEETLLKLHKDQYQWFLGVALIALFIETLISDRKNRIKTQWTGRLSQ